MCAEIEQSDVYKDAANVVTANLPDPAGLKGLIAAAGCRTPAVRRESVRMLRRRGTKRAVEALASVARSDPEEALRMDALSVIASLENRAAVEALIELVEEEREDTKGAALRHLRGLTGREFETYAEWQGWWQENKVGFVPRRRAAVPPAPGP